MAWRIPLDAWCSLIFSVKCLPDSLEPWVASAAAVAALKFSQCNILWEAFHRLGVQGVEGLILVGVLFPPSVGPASQGGFGVMELTQSASVPWSPSTYIINIVN
jgi:hypothetical protein